MRQAAGNVPLGARLRWAQPRRPVWARALWSLFLVVDVPLLLATIVGLGAIYMHPRHFWWAQLVAIALPYATWLLVAALMGTLLARRWLWSLLHGVLLVFVLARTFPPERLFDQPESAPGDLTVVTFNVPQSGPSGEALADSLVALVETAAPDLLALQEAHIAAPTRESPGWRAIHIEAVAERLPYRLAVPGRMSRRPDWRNMTEVPLLVRNEYIEVLEQQVIASGTPEDEEGSSAMRTRFRWQEREGVLYNVHLRSFGEQKPWQDRILPFEPDTWLPYLRRYRDAFRARAADVEHIAGAIDEETLPVLVVGDFNSTANNWIYRRLRGARRDAFRIGGEGLGHTYRADQPLVRIDFILADPAWDVIGASVLPVAFSDHRPVVARLRWRVEDSR